MLESAPPLVTPTLTLAAWVHDLSPFALRISGDFGIRWYGLSYVLGFVCAWMLMTWLAKRGRIAIPAHRVADAMLWMVLGVVVGGRLGYVLIYEPALLAHFESAPPYWGLLQLNRGGMAFHGGLVGVGLACWRVSRGFRSPAGRVEGRCEVLHVCDVLAFVCTIGLGLGRIANFVNGELLGKIIAPPGQPAPWWSVRFPQELLLPPSTGPAHKPVLSDAQLQGLEDVIAKHVPGATYSEAGLVRLIDKLQDAPANVSRTISGDLAPFLSARHPSQLYQAFLEGVVLTIIVWWVGMKPRAAGVVMGTFFISYGVLRVIAEFFRLPDAQFAVGRPLGLSRGQWLSAIMVVVGFAVLMLARRSTARTWRGWRDSGAAHA